MQEVTVCSGEDLCTRIWPKVGFSKFWPLTSKEGLRGNECVIWCTRARCSYAIRCGFGDHRSLTCSDNAVYAQLDRPTLVVGGLRFYHDFAFFFLWSSPTLRAGWMKLNQNRPHARKWVRFVNACPNCGVSLPLQIRGRKNDFLSTTSQLNGNFNGLYLPNETWYT